MERIKILFFIEELRAGGAEKVLCSLVNEMDQTQFDITVQTLWKGNAEQYLKPGIRYRYCYANKSRFNKYRSRLEAAAGLTYPLHIKRSCDIEAAYLEFGATKIMAGSTNRRAKKIAWVHCDLKKRLRDPEAFVKKTAKWYERFDTTVCVSQTVKQSFDTLFGGIFPSIVLHNTIDDKQIRELAKADLPLPLTDDLPVICAVGRLAGPKNYLRLLRVHLRLLREGLAHRLWIVGEGPDRMKLEAFLTENSLQNTVTLTGFQENPYPFMAKADLLVCSSDYEGLSTFVTEGLILGKPIVTTDCGGMRELLGDSEHGLIVDINEDALCTGIRQMLTDPALRAEYASRAEAKGMDFTARKLTEETERCLLELSGGNHEG